MAGKLYSPRRFYLTRLDLELSHLTQSIQPVTLVFVSDPDLWGSKGDTALTSKLDPP